MKIYMHLEKEKDYRLEHIALGYVINYINKKTPVVYFKYYPLEDMCNDCWVKMIQYPANKSRGNRTVINYYITMCLQEIRNKMYKNSGGKICWLKKLHKKDYIKYKFNEKHDVSNENPVQEVLDTERFSRIDEFINEILKDESENVRDYVVRFFLKDETLAEIAKDNNCSKQNINTIILRFIDRVKDKKNLLKKYKDLYNE